MSTVKTTHDFRDGNAEVPAHQHINGSGFIHGDARVYENAPVSGDAKVYETSPVSGDAWVDENSDMTENDSVNDYFWICFLTFLLWLLFLWGMLNTIFD